MIRPVELQLSLWRVEEATHRRNPEAAPAQALQDEEIGEERRLRDRQVQSTDSTEGRRIGDENRGRQERGQGRRRAPHREKAATERADDEGGLDLMA